MYFTSIFLFKCFQSGFPVFVQYNCVTIASMMLTIIQFPMVGFDLYNKHTNVKLQTKLNASSHLNS